MKFIRTILILSVLVLPFTCHASMRNKTNQMAVVDMSTCHEMKNPTKPFILVLKRGEPIINSIVECIERMNIDSASISGMGAIEGPEVAAYNLRKRHYNSKNFPGIYELTSINGTVTTSSKNQKIGNFSVTFCDMSYRAYGGHLMAGSVGVTVEITVIPFSKEIQRKPDHDIGLDLIEAK